MNFYIIVEGDKTEMSVYPAWLSILAPEYTQIDNAWNVGDNNYYIFSAGGIPSIYTHVKNAIMDINKINSTAGLHYDYFLVCLDTEEETKDYILQRINEELQSNNVSLQNAELMVFEHKVCMETWFLGNSKLYKNNPQNKELLNYAKFYNVGKDDPEEMGNIDKNRFSKKAQFHLRYLKRMLEERNMVYSKSNTKEIQKPVYLEQLIKRFEETGHIESFGNWYEFVKNNFK